MYRHEYKYIISLGQLEVLQNRINHFVSLDPHVIKTGSYNIRSLYFDDYDDTCMFENENGTDPREKYRIRIYNHQVDRIKLECKRKEREKTLKTSCSLDREEAECLIRGKPSPTIVTSKAVLNRLNIGIIERLMRPVTIVEYDRIPYIYPLGNVRITFDMNICASSSFSLFFHDIIPKRPILPLDCCLMEVKFDGFLPDYFYSLLELGSFSRTAFSKYYLSRKYSF